MAGSLKITFLGGLGDIGRNCAVLESEGQALLVDCGLMFPRLEMLGVDLVLPDFGYILERQDMFVGCLLTHGHEDHTGGLSFLLKDMPLHLVGTPLTLELARGRIEEAGLLQQARFSEVSDGQRIALGPFDLEFIPVAHSVPHGCATVLRTSAGTILHSGDWKLDHTPVDGRRTDLGRFGAVADAEGFRLLLGDSTNADEPGYSPSESLVGDVLYSLFHRYEGRRVIATCFASHLHRVQQIASVAIGFGRRVATLGMSMRRNVAIGQKMGILSIPDGALIDIEDVDRFAPGEVCVISTGSQGEPMSALALMASGQSRWLKITPDDVVVLSSHPIPGNEMNVARVLDGLVRYGAEVVHSGIAEVHATGHAQEEEIKTLLTIAEPEWLVPIHGEYRHMVAHSRVAQKIGMSADRVVVCEDGDQLVLDDDGLRKVGTVPAAYVYVDGIVGDIGKRVLRDRRLLSEDGVLVVSIALDPLDRTMLGRPDLNSRGWVHVPDSEILMHECQAVIERGVGEYLASSDPFSTEKLEQTIRRSVGQFVSERTRRRPTIVVSVILTANPED